MFIATHHAVQRFTERFAGNLSEPAARARIERIAQNARYVQEMGGHAKLYVAQHIAFVIEGRTIMTVYPRSAASCDEKARRKGLRRRGIDSANEVTDHESIRTL